MVGGRELGRLTGWECGLSVALATDRGAVEIGFGCFTAAVTCGGLRVLLVCGSWLHRSIFSQYLTRPRALRSRRADPGNAFCCLSHVI